MAQTFTYLTDSTGQIWQFGVNADGTLSVTAVASIPGASQAPTVTAFPQITGQTLLNLANDNLAGLANSVTPDQLLSFINEGKDEIWSILKQLNERFFVTSSQNSDTTKTNYFADLNTQTREYTLPTDLRDILFIEITAPTGYETIKFVHRPMVHPEFRDARTASTAFQDQGGTIPFSGFTDYLYDVVGQGTLVLAQFPEVAFSLKIWYVRALPDITIGGVVDEIVFPFSKKIVEFAVMKILLSKEDYNGFMAWKAEWKDSIVNAVQGVDRQSADPIYSADFLG